MSDKALHEESAATLTRLKEQHKELKKELAKAPAFAVFPSMGRASLVLGGAHGRGEVYEHGKPIGFARLNQMTIGVQVGGQTFSEIVIFKDHNAFKGFKEGKVTWNFNASAVLVKAGGSGTANQDGLVAHAYTQGGLLLEASLGGQKLTFVPPQKNAEQKSGWFGRKEKEEDGEQRRGLFGRKKEQEEEEPKRGLLGKIQGKQDEDGEKPLRKLFGRKQQEEEDGAEGNERFQSARNFVSRHPVATAVLAPGISFTAALLARRLLASGGGEEEQEAAR